MGIQHSGTITIRPQQKIPEHRDTRRLGMERIKPKTTSNSPSHQTTNTGKQIETPRTTIIPMKLIPANKQTTFEKLPINVIHLGITGTKIGIRYHTQTKKEKSCLNLALDPGRTDSYIKKRKKTQEEGRKDA